MVQTESHEYLGDMERISRNTFATTHEFRDYILGPTGKVAESIADLERLRPAEP